jgi:hypothetical protein
LSFARNPIKKIPDYLGKIKASTVSLEQTDIEELPVWIFTSGIRSITLSRKTGSIRLPDISAVPEHEIDLSIYGNQDSPNELSTFMKVVYARRKREQ